MAARTRKTAEAPKAPAQDDLLARVIAAGSDPEAVKAAVGAVAAEWRTTQTGNVEGTERLTVAAAHATWALCKANLFPYSGTKTLDGSEPTFTMEEVRAMFASRRTVKDTEAKPLSAATISTWRVAGRAYDVHGIVPESDRGKALLNRYGQATVVKEAVAADTMSEDDLSVAIAAEDKRKEEADEKRKAEAKAKAKPKEVEIPRNNSGLLDLMETCLAKFGKDGSISPAEAARFAEFQTAVEAVAGSLTVEAQAS